MSEHPFVTMLRQQEDAGDTDERQFPVWEAQLQTLREVQALADHPRLFGRGDIVRFIGATGPMRNIPDGMCLMFWRMLDPEAIDDQQRLKMVNTGVLVTLDEVDCLVILFDGSAVLFHLASTALLERDPRQDTVR